MSKESRNFYSLASIQTRCNESFSESEARNSSDIVKTVCFNIGRNKKIKKMPKIHFGSKDNIKTGLRTNLSFDKISFLNQKDKIILKNVKTISFSSLRKKMNFKFYKFEEEKINMNHNFIKSLHQINNDNDCETDEEVFTNALIHNFDTISHSLKKFERSQRKKDINPFRFKRTKNNL